MTALHSGRLFLAPFEVGDAGDLFLIRSDPDAMAYWDWPVDESRAHTQAVAELMLDEVASGRSQIWTGRTHDYAFVGVFDISDLNGDEADIGFMIARDRWGQGYAFEATSLVVAHARALGLKRLAARIHIGNARSERLLERLGFKAIEERSIEVRPGVTRQCRYFMLALA